jgi:hemolysin III
MKNTSLLNILFDSISHGLGVIIGIIVLVILLVSSNSGYDIASSIIFSVAVIYMFLMSTLYHSLVKTKAKAVFKRLDHSAIYFLIASSFVPFLLLAVDNAPDYLSIIVMYTVATIGIVFKAINPHKYEKFHLILFLAMGWTAVLFIGDIYSYSQMSFYFLTLGGVMYTVGVLFYAIIKFRLSHFVWHIFVLLGLVSHSISIYFLLITK